MTPDDRPLLPAEPRLSADQPRCNFGCSTTAFHDLHLFHEPGSPYPMRVVGKSVHLWLPSGEVLRRRQPDAIRALRADVRALDEQRAREAFEDAVDVAAKAALL